MSAPVHAKPLTAAAQVQQVRDLLGTALLQRETMTSRSAGDAARDEATDRYVRAVDAMIDVLADLRGSGALASIQNFLVWRDGA